MASEEADILFQFEKLKKIKSKLKWFGGIVFFGFVILVLLFGSVIISSSDVVVGSRTYFSDFRFVRFLGTCSILVFIISAIFSFVFNAINNKGLVIHNALNEKLGSNGSLVEKIALNDYLQASSLPFTKGSRGILLYLIMFIMVGIGIIFFETNLPIPPAGYY